MARPTGHLEFLDDLCIIRQHFDASVWQLSEPWLACPDGDLIFDDLLISPY